MHSPPFDGTQLMDIVAPREPERMLRRVATALSIRAVATIGFLGGALLQAKFDVGGNAVSTPFLAVSALTLLYIVIAVGGRSIRRHYPFGRR